MGRLPSDRKNLLDYAGRQAAIGLFGDLIVENRVDDISAQFQYNVSPYDFDIQTQNGGTVTQADSMAVVSSSTDPLGEAVLTSLNHLRYRAGHDGFCYFTAIFTVTGSVPSQSGIAGANQYIGILNGQDGYFLGFNGEDFVIGRRYNSVDNLTTREHFNLDRLDGTGRTAFNIDFSKLNVFRISFGWLGGSAIYFEVQNELGQFIPFHIIKYPNSSTTPSIRHPSNPMSAIVTKSSGTTDVILRTASWNAGSVNTQQTERSNRYFSFLNSKTFSGGQTNIFTLFNKITYFGEVNHVQAKTIHVSMSIDGGASSNVFITKNATLGGSPSFSDVDTDSSIMEVDTDGTTVTGGTLEIAFALGSNSDLTINVVDMEITLLPGETVTFGGVNSANGTLAINARWEEQF